MRALNSGALSPRALIFAATVALTLAASSASAAAQDGVDDLTIELREFDASGVSGWSTLVASEDGSIRITMAVEGEAITGDHPTHIHTGTCTDFDPNPTYPLTTVILDPLSNDGISTTTVTQVTFDELLADDYVIVVHKSAKELTNYLVCGEINESNAMAAVGSAGSVTVPATGVGTAATVPDRGPIFAALGVLVVALVTAGLILRRSPIRP